MKSRNATRSSAFAIVGVAGIVSALLASACGPAHIERYQPKQRVFDPVPQSTSDARASTSGSLWRDGQLAGGLFVDARAFRAQDVVIVRVEEVADAQRSADTDVE